MPKISNFDLLTSLIVATDQDKIDWQPTGSPQEFTASFGGKWTILLHSPLYGPLANHVVLYVRNSEGDSMVRFDDTEDNRLPGLYEMARRHALKVDEALADLLREIDKPQE